MSEKNSTEILRQYEMVLNRIKNIHIKCFPGHPEPIFLISNAYPGVWLEHAYDAIAWADFCPEMAFVARAQVNLFLDNQKEDGQFPCYVLDESNPNTKNYRRLIGFGQLQECVSFTRLCYEAALLNQDNELMERAYQKCSAWDAWMCRNRMTAQNRLVELFCLFDTGHDNSDRLAGIPGGCPNGDAKRCNEGDDLPLIAPDINAVFYGSRMALADMAEHLGKTKESASWREKAQKVKQALIETCYDPEDEFFYDVDRQGSKRKFKTIHITNLFCEHVLDQDMADKIFHRYLRNEKEFWTPYPFSSMSISDPHFNKEREGNDWSYFSQGLTALRALRWMDDYGYGADLEELMRIWTDALVRSETVKFSQELDPFTGEMSKGCEWYSATMLFFIHSVKRLFGI
jgi:hypothetical protein